MMPLPLVDRAQLRLWSDASSKERGDFRTRLWKMAQAACASRIVFALFRVLIQLTPIYQ